MYILKILEELFKGDISLFLISTDMSHYKYYL